MVNVSATERRIPMSVFVPFVRSLSVLAEVRWLGDPLSSVVVFGGEETDTGTKCW